MSRSSNARDESGRAGLRDPLLGSRSRDIEYRSLVGSRSATRDPELLPRGTKIREVRETKRAYGSMKKRLERRHSAPAHVGVDADVVVGAMLKAPMAADTKSRAMTMYKYTYAFPFRKVVLVFTVYLGVGVLCFYFMEADLQGVRTNYRFLDALYICIVTMTSIGYGDLTPHTLKSQLFTCAYVFVGFGLMGWLLGAVTNFFVDHQHLLLLKALNSRKVKKLVDAVDPSHRFMRKVNLKVAVASLTFMLLFGVGFIVLVTVEGMDVLEAFYCVCVSITTLGYGDYSFQTVAGRAFAVVWLLVSTINVAQLYLYITEWYMESRRRALVKWVLNRRMTLSDLEAADMDDDHVVSPSEFIVFKLKEMGKIEQNDVDAILEEFDALDVDQSGTLTAEDLV